MRSAVATVLVVLASVLAFLSLFAVWARRQALDGPTWGDTSERIVQNGEVRTALADYLAGQLVANADARRVIASALLTEAQQTQGTDALRGAITKVAAQALATPEAQQAFRTASIAAQRELIRALDGNDRYVSVRNGTVTIDLRALLGVLAQEIQVPVSLVDQLPAADTRIVVLHSSEVGVAQDALGGVRGLSILLPILTVLLWLLALYVARGRRRATLAWIAAGLLLAAVAVLVTRSLAESAVLDRVVTRPSDRPAAGQTWGIATSLLRDTAIAVIVAAALVLAGLAAWHLLHRGGPDTRRQDELSDLDRMRAAGTIGEGEYASRRRRLTS